MSRTVIKFGLNEAEIDRAIKEIETYKRRFLEKVETFRKCVAEEIAKAAEENFSIAEMDDVVNGNPRKPDVKVYVDERGGISVVVAEGEDAVFCEFGAGVYHNGAAGSSPHPKGSDLGLTIGSYGKGHGKQTAWGYYDDGGNLVITRGTVAQLPMYHAAREVAARAVEIAREVFGND